MTRSEIMSRIRGKDTKPELRVRKALRRLGFIGYRLHHGKCKIDIAFTRRKVAIFVDGCFWHGCPEHFRMPKTNVGFWRGKIERNVERDAKVNGELEGVGWSVVRIWEHQLDRDTLDSLLLGALRKGLDIA